MTAHYLFGGLPIASAAPLPLLPVLPSSVTAPVLTVTRRLRPMPPRAIRAWRHRWRDDEGRIVMGVAMMRSGYLIRFPRQCDFVVSADATRIDVRPHGHIAVETLEHLLADQVIPRCLAQRGELVVHASGVALGQSIALFVGESGRGKSTLAGLFLRAGRTILTDDSLLLRPAPDAVRARATYAGLRLNPDSADALFPDAAGIEEPPSYSDKRRFTVPDARAEAAAGRASALYFLGDECAEPDHCRIERLPPGAACIRLMEQSFQLDVLDRDAVGRLLGRAGEIVTRVPAFTLDYRREFKQSAALLASIERHFASVDRRLPPS